MQPWKTRRRLIRLMKAQLAQTQIRRTRTRTLTIRGMHTGGEGHQRARDLRGAIIRRHAGGVIHLRAEGAIHLRVEDMARPHAGGLFHHAAMETLVEEGLRLHVADKIPRHLDGGVVHLLLYHALVHLRHHLVHAEEREEIHRHVTVGTPLAGETILHPVVGIAHLVAPLAIARPLVGLEMAILPRVALT